MLPHFHISGIHGWIVFLFVVAVFGSLHLAAVAHPENVFSRAWTEQLPF
jgi:hypothetical protein